MAGPLLYRPAPKWQIFAAFGAALTVHAIAVGIAALKPPEPPPADITQLEQIAEVTFEPAPPAPPEPTPPPEEPDPIEPPPIPEEKPEFVEEEKPTPPPKRTEKPKTVAPIARPQQQAGPPGPMSMSSAKAVAISAPRPEYPYEARRSKITGSGICVMTVDTSSGSVTSAEMAKSTGNAILDNAATSAFRRWRFRPGTVSKVRTPITFTMTGAQF
ncbi:MAG TPA: energy transducer TonB [Chthoniobacterales bacterium]|nr:energy transducer TonB [Chthoniobacterales bacterium]